MTEDQKNEIEYLEGCSASMLTSKGIRRLKELEAESFLLEDITEGGPYLAELPAIITGKKLKVEIDIWEAYGTEGTEVAVRLTSGSLKDRSLYDEELEGAKFYPDHLTHQ